MKSVLVEEIAIFIAVKFRSSCHNRDGDGSISSWYCRNHTCCSYAKDYNNNRSIQIANCRIDCTFCCPGKIYQPESEKQQARYKRITRLNAKLIHNIWAHVYLIRSRLERLIVPRDVGIGPYRMYRFRIITRSVIRRVFNYFFIVNSGHGRF